MKEGLHTNHKTILFFLAYLWPIWMPILAYLNGRGEKLKYRQGWRMIAYGHVLYLIVLILLARMDLGVSNYLAVVFLIFYLVSAVVNSALNLYIIFSRHMSSLTAWLDNYFDLSSTEPAAE
jgi:hypothetical protein